MISIARIFGAPDSVPGRERRLQHVERAEARPQHPFDVRHDVHHVRVALDDHPVGHFHRSGDGDAADVVARQVDQHHVLGDLLRVLDQLFRQRDIVLRRLPARTRAGQRTDRHLGAFGIFSWRTRISGDAPTTWKSPKL
jgi:hypothetical protein